MTTFVALFPSIAEAQSDECSLRDVAAWQTQLLDPDEEITPAYILQATEAFMNRCPERPEFREASKIAAMAATETGDVKTAVAHFANAGRLRSDAARFYHAAALLADGRDDQAWALRDTMIEDWRDELSHDPQVDVNTTQVAGGTIHSVRFMRPDQNTGIGAAWLAVPDGAGWPATLTIGSERQLAAFHKMRAGADASKLRHVDLYRCRGRRLLARAEAEFPVVEMESAAAVTMIGYLSRPDMLTMTQKGQPLETCLWPNRILPRPAH
ncbi:MAG: hypothetical protein L3J02_07665 [Henriciella sp.]|nr:hypothetical protein [Henriciella sp.]